MGRKPIALFFPHTITLLQLVSRQAQNRGLSVLRDIRAAIFDMDGLLFDTENIARWAWQQALASHGYIMNDNFYNELVGRDLSWRERILKQRYGNNFPFEAVTRQRIEI